MEKTDIDMWKVPYFCPRCIPDSRTFAHLSALRTHLEDDHVYYSPEPLNSNNHKKLRLREINVSRDSTGSLSTFVSKNSLQSRDLTVPMVTHVSRKSQAAESRIKGLRNALMKAHSDILLLTEERKTLHREILDLHQKRRQLPKEMKDKMSSAKPEMQHASAQMTLTSAHVGVGTDDKRYILTQESLMLKEREQIKNGFNEKEKLFKKEHEQVLQKLRQETENAKERDKEEWETRSKELEAEIRLLTARLETNQEKVVILMQEMEVKSEYEREAFAQYQKELESLSMTLKEKEKLIEDHERDAEHNKELWRKISQKETLARQELDELISGLYTQLEDKEFQLRQGRRRQLVLQTFPQITAGNPVADDPGYHERQSHAIPSSLYFATNSLKIPGDHVTPDTSGVLTASGPLSAHDNQYGDWALSTNHKGLHVSDNYDQELYGRNQETDVEEDLPLDEDGIIWD